MKESIFEETESIYDTIEQNDLDDQVIDNADTASKKDGAEENRADYLDDFLRVFKMLGFGCMLGITMYLLAFGPNPFSEGLSNDLDNSTPSYGVNLDSLDNNVTDLFEDAGAGLGSMVLMVATMGMIIAMITATMRAIVRKL